MNAAAVPMEPKICEGGCGRTFMRPVPLTAKLGQKMCRACWRLSPAGREAQYEHQRIAEAKARVGLL